VRRSLGVAQIQEFVKNESLITNLSETQEVDDSL